MGTIGSRWSVTIAVLAIVTVWMLCAVASAQDTLFQQNFDGKSIGPWSSQGTGSYAPNEGTRNPAGVAAYSEPNLLYISAPSGGQERVFPNYSFDTDGYSSWRVRFWMYHDTGFPDANDRLRIQVSTNGAVNWSSVDSSIARYTGVDNWQQHEVDLSDYVGLPSVYLGFLAQGDGGNDIHIDNIEVTATVVTPEATPSNVALGTQLTISGNHFGTATGKARLIPNVPDSKPLALKLVTWTDTEIVCMVAKDSLPGAHNLEIQRKEPAKAYTLVAPSAVEFKAPEITSIVTSPAAPGSSVTVNGNYFGAKKPQIALTTTAGDLTWKCKVVTWSMDPVSGASSAEFIVPLKLPAATTYDLWVINKTGSAESVGGFATP